MIKKIILTAITLLFNISISNAQIRFLPPPPSGSFVADEANIIDPQTQNKINQISKSLLEEEKIPLFVVTIPSLINYQAGNYNVDQYARMLFDKWGIGFKNHNYGILLLISKGDRKARIEFGAGWNNAHDQEASYIMNDLIIPNFKTGNYSKGTLLGAQGLNSAARGLELPKNLIQIPIWAIILGFIVIVFVIISLFVSGKKGWAWSLIVALALILWFLIKSLSSGSGLGGGSGGGGGASGSW